MGPHALLHPPRWIGNNNSGTSTLYDGKSNFIPLVVTIPPPAGSPAGTLAAPTGTVFNGSPADFLLAPGKQAIFILATEDGTISGWNPGIDLHNAVLKVDNSDNGSANGAVYKGATSADINGRRFLYVTNFRSGRVEVYDTNFKRAHLGEDAFEAEGVPRGFARTIPSRPSTAGGRLLSPVTGPPGSQTLCISRPASTANRTASSAPLLPRTASTATKNNFPRDPLFL